MFGDQILKMIGKQDPRLAMLAALQGGTAPGRAGPGAGAGTPGATTIAGGPPQPPPGPAPQPEVYKSPDDLMSLYGELLDYNRRSQSINTGIGLIGASLAQPENRAGILSAFTGEGAGGGVEAPETFLSSVLKFQQDQQALQRQAAIRATLPAIAKKYGLDIETAQYLFDTGKLDSVIAEAEKPERQVVQQEDGTHVIVDLATGALSDPFGVPKKREIELIDDPIGGGKIAVYKDDKSRVGKGDIAGAGNTETEQLWNATNADRAKRGLPPISLEDFNLQSKRAGSGVSNFGPSGIDFGDPESGYVWKRGADGSIQTTEDGRPIQVPIAGGSVEQGAEDAKKKEAERDSQSLMAADIVVQNIDDALSLIDENADSWVPVTGWGATLDFLPNTPQYDAARAVETIRSNVGFDKLQQMRDNSPTGAALGPVSDFENRLLQSTIGSLDLKQSPERIRKQLFVVRAVYDAIINKGIPDQETAASITKQAEEAFQARYGELDIDSILRKYGHE